MGHSTTLCTFGLADLHELREVPASVGWNDSLEDWRTIVHCGHVIGHRDTDGLIVSTGVLFDFGDVYSIGKMVVRPSHQGRGLAREVMENLLSQCRPGVHTSLVATTMGEPVYKKFKFETTERVHKLFAHPVRDKAFIESTDEAAFNSLLAYDRIAFGADRTKMLRARREQSSACIATEASAAMRTRGDPSVIGPVFARDATHAFETIMALAGLAEGRCRIDIPERHVDLIAKLSASGFNDVSTHAVMTRAGSCPPGKRNELFALASQAWG